MKEKIKLLLIHMLIELGSLTLSLLGYWLVLMGWLHGILSIHCEDKETQHDVEMIGIVVIGYTVGRFFNFFFRFYSERWDRTLNSLK